MMGIGTAEGPDRASKAVEQAFLSPLLNDCDLRTAKGVVVNITSGKEDGGLTVTELQQIICKLLIEIRIFSKYSPKIMVEVF